MSLRCALDFDHCLSDPRMQAFARMLIKAGNEVWVVTARSKQGTEEPFFQKVVKDSHIPLQNVIYTHDKPKYTWLDSMGFDVFIDNSKKEVIDAACYTSCIPLQFVNEL